MNISEAIKNRRTIRKFEQKPVDRSVLVHLVDLARIAAYPANIQPLKFAIIDSKEITDKIFVMTKWAGYLSDGTPKENERPTAYIAILGDTKIKQSENYEVEAGSAVTTMMLGALEEGLGTCWLGAIDRDGIKSLLNLDSSLNVVYLLAIGYPAQKSKAVEIKNGDIKYFEQDGVINVPKRSLDEIIVN